ncbi:hypothetical protein BESB_048470 [Besnoitia besnoiti]|uniref:Ubiquitin-like protease family profile domain-containing protein n=1 Tax=Besnoitia besnoiti TaxID=94643 RepID=A0A2A9MFA2_BESBE|nr:hypothetical protein BESB_048470 [Besnoitia besnoiti]PFH36655.1 hypothetical protein BESB_048470 [Besnoitia besnoiti]
MYRSSAHPSRAKTSADPLSDLREVGLLHEMGSRGARPFKQPRASLHVSPAMLSSASSRQSLRSLLLGGAESGRRREDSQRRLADAGKDDPDHAPIRRERRGMDSEEERRRRRRDAGLFRSVSLDGGNEETDEDDFRQVENSRNLPSRGAGAHSGRGRLLNVEEDGKARRKKERKTRPSIAGASSRARDRREREASSDGGSPHLLGRRLGFASPALTPRKGSSLAAADGESRSHSAAAGSRRRISKEKHNSLEVGTWSSAHAPRRPAGAATWHASPPAAAALDSSASSHLSSSSSSAAQSPDSNAVLAPSWLLSTLGVFPAEDPSVAAAVPASRGLPEDGEPAARGAREQRAGAGSDERPESEEVKPLQMGRSRMKRDDRRKKTEPERRRVAAGAENESQDEEAGEAPRQALFPRQHARRRARGDQGLSSEGEAQGTGGGGKQTALASPDRQERKRRKYRDAEAEDARGASRADPTGTSISDSEDGRGSSAVPQPRNEAREAAGSAAPGGSSIQASGRKHDEASARGAGPVEETKKREKGRRGASRKKGEKPGASVLSSSLAASPSRLLYPASTLVGSALRPASFLPSRGLGPAGTVTSLMPSLFTSARGETRGVAGLSRLPLEASFAPATALEPRKEEPSAGGGRDEAADGDAGADEPRLHEAGLESLSADEAGERAGRSAHAERSSGSESLQAPHARATPLSLSALLQAPPRPARVPQSAASVADTRRQEKDSRAAREEGRDGRLRREAFVGDEGLESSPRAKERQLEAESRVEVRGAAGRCPVSVCAGEERGEAFFFVSAADGGHTEDAPSLPGDLQDGAREGEAPLYAEGGAQKARRGVSVACCSVGIQCEEPGAEREEGAAKAGTLGQNPFPSLFQGEERESEADKERREFLLFCQRLQSTRSHASPLSLSLHQHASVPCENVESLSAAGDLEPRPPFEAADRAAGLCFGGGEGEEDEEKFAYSPSSSASSSLPSSPLHTRKADSGLRGAFGAAAADLCGSSRGRSAASVPGCVSSPLASHFPSSSALPPLCVASFGTAPGALFGGAGTPRGEVVAVSLREVSGGSSSGAPTSRWPVSGELSPRAETDDGDPEERERAAGLWRVEELKQLGRQVALWGERRVLAGAFFLEAESREHLLEVLGAQLEEEDEAEEDDALQLQQEEEEDFREAVQQQLLFFERLQRERPSLFPRTLASRLRREKREEASSPEGAGSPQAGKVRRASGALLSPLTQQAKRTVERRKEERDDDAFSVHSDSTVCLPPYFYVGLSPSRVASPLKGRASPFRRPELAGVSGSKSRQIDSSRAETLTAHSSASRSAARQPQGGGRRRFSSESCAAPDGGMGGESGAPARRPESQEGEEADRGKEREDKGDEDAAEETSSRAERARLGAESIADDHLSPAESPALLSPARAASGAAEGHRERERAEDDETKEEKGEEEEEEEVRPEDGEADDGGSAEEEPESGAARRWMSLAAAHADEAESAEKQLDASEREDASPAQREPRARLAEEEASNAGSEREEAEDEMRSEEQAPADEAAGILRAREESPPTSSLPSFPVLEALASSAVSADSSPVPSLEPACAPALLFGEETGGSRVSALRFEGEAPPESNACVASSAAVFSSAPLASASAVSEHPSGGLFVASPQRGLRRRSRGHGSRSDSPRSAARGDSLGGGRAQGAAGPAGAEETAAEAESDASVGSGHPSSASARSSAEDLSLGGSTEEAQAGNEEDEKLEDEEREDEEAGAGGARGAEGRGESRVADGEAGEEPGEDGEEGPDEAKGGGRWEGSDSGALGVQVSDFGSSTEETETRPFSSRPASDVDMRPQAHETPESPAEALAARRAAANEEEASAGRASVVIASAPLGSTVSGGVGLAPHQELSVSSFASPRFRYASPLPDEVGTPTPLREVDAEVQRELEESGELQQEGTADMTDFSREGAEGERRDVEQARSAGWSGFSANSERLSPAKVVSSTFFSPSHSALPLPSAAFLAALQDSPPSSNASMAFPSSSSSLAGSPALSSSCFFAPHSEAAPREESTRPSVPAISSSAVSASPAPPFRLFSAAYLHTQALDERREGDAAKGEKEAWDVSGGGIAVSAALCGGLRGEQPLLPQESAKLRAEPRTYATDRGHRTEARRTAEGEEGSTREKGTGGERRAETRGSLSLSTRRARGGRTSGRRSESESSNESERRWRGGGDREAGAEGLLAKRGAEGRENEEDEGAAQREQHHGEARSGGAVAAKDAHGKPKEAARRRGVERGRADPEDDDCIVIEEEGMLAGGEGAPDDGREEARRHSEPADLWPLASGGERERGSVERNGSRLGAVADCHREVLLSLKRKHEEESRKKFPAATPQQHAASVPPSSLSSAASSSSRPSSSLPSLRRHPASQAPSFSLQPSSAAASSRQSHLLLPASPSLRSPASLQPTRLSDRLAQATAARLRSPCASLPPAKKQRALSPPVPSARGAASPARSERAAAARGGAETAPSGATPRDFSLEQKPDTPGRAESPAGAVAASSASPVLIVSDEDEEEKARQGGVSAETGDTREAPAEQKKCASLKLGGRAATEAEAHAEAAREAEANGRPRKTQREERCAESDARQAPAAAAGPVEGAQPDARKADPGEMRQEKEGTGEQKRNDRVLERRKVRQDEVELQSPKSRADPEKKPAQSAFEAATPNRPVTRGARWKIAPEDQAALTGLLHRVSEVRGNDGEVVVHRAGIPLTIKSLRGLLPGGLLDDEVINLYMVLLQERDDRSLRISQTRPDTAASTRHRRCQFFPSHFYASLRKSGYEGVRRWTMRKKVDIFGQDLLVFPLHVVAETHWALGVVNFSAGAIEYYDSLDYKEEGKEFGDRIRDYLRREHLDKKGRPFHAGKSLRSVVKRVPHQENSSDCGVFCCQFAEHLGAARLAFDFSQVDITPLRYKMMLQLSQTYVA